MSSLYFIFSLGPLPTTPDGWKYVCTFTDYFTKFVDFYAIKSKSAEREAKCIKTFTCRYHDEIVSVQRHT